MNDDGESESTLPSVPVMNQLESALKAYGIDVVQGSVQLLLDQRQWIYPSIRVKDLLKKLKGEEDLYSIFNAQHHIQSPF